MLQANSADPDQKPHSEASDQGPRFLPLSHYKDAMLIWANKSNVLDLNQIKRAGNSEPTHCQCLRSNKYKNENE